MFIYPKLPAVRTFSFFRIGGNGLANCMFIAARALVKSKKYNLQFIEPTWLNLSLGTYLRNQKDKRHYSGLFDTYSNINGLKKSIILLIKRKVYNENDISKNINSDSIFVEEGLGGYFEDILSEYSIIAEYFNKIIRKSIIKGIEDKDFSKSIAVHIRLGDYSDKLRIPISWYKDAIEYINSHTNSEHEFLVFSDGSLAELEEVLKINNVKFFFGGNALADIIAISRCKFLLGSDSTFSGWGAYLGQVPSLFAKKHYGKILENEEDELVSHDIYNDPKVELLVKRVL